MRDPTQYFVAPTESVKDAMQVIDRGAIGMALIVQGARLVGLLTDGDVRRALLRDAKLDTPVSQVMRVDFRYLRAPTCESEAVALMRREGLYHLPILDPSDNVVQLFLLDDTRSISSIDIPVVIMAGGEGRRLRPLTDSCPKPMLKVNDRPIIEIIISNCIDAGFKEFYISVNYLKEQIKCFLKDGRDFGVRINYLEESKPLGTAGALALLDDKLPGPFLVLNGDVLSHINYRSLLGYHRHHSSDVTICAYKYKTHVPYGVIDSKDGVFLDLTEKPSFYHLINAGVYILNKEALTLIPRNSFFDMPELIQLAASLKKRVFVFEHSDYWLDVGHLEAFNRAGLEWK